MPRVGRYLLGGLIAVALAAGVFVVSRGVERPPSEPQRTEVAPLPFEGQPHEAAPAAFAGTDEQVAELRLELEAAHEQALSEARAAFPEWDSTGGDALAAPALDPERGRRQQAKRDALAAAAERKYRTQIAHRHGLTLEQLDQIDSSGRAPR